MKEIIPNYALLLEKLLFKLDDCDRDTALALCNLLREKAICEAIYGNYSKYADTDDEAPELDLKEGNVSIELYHDLCRAARLLSLVGRKPQEFMEEASEFLFGCPYRWEDFTDDEINVIRFDPNTEAIDNRMFYYGWMHFGAFGEIRMAVKVDSEKGTVHPLPFIPVQSDYEHFPHSSERTLLSYTEIAHIIDGIFSHCIIPDEVKSDDCDDFDFSDLCSDTFDDADDWEEEWVEDIPDDEWEEDQDEDVFYTEEWVEDIPDENNDNEEEEDVWYTEEWVEDIPDKDEDNEEDDETEGTSEEYKK